MDENDKAKVLEILSRISPSGDRPTAGNVFEDTNNSFVGNDVISMWSHNRSYTKMLMYGKEASNRKQEIDRQHYTIPNQRPKDKHCGKI